MPLLRHTPPARLLARAASALALLFLALAAPLHGQADGGDTWALISPDIDTVTAPSLAVTVNFYDNASLNTNTRSIIFNGVPVQNSFTHTPVTTTFPGMVTTSSSATLTLQPGDNTLWASICDNTDCGDTTRVTFTYAGRPAVQVRPDGGTATAGASVATTHQFRVVNPGSGPGTYTLRPECRDAWTGGQVAGCTASAASVTVAAGDSVGVTVTLPGGAAGAARVVRLSAELARTPGVSDAGWVDMGSVGAGGSAQVAPQVQAVPLTAGTVVDRSECVTVAVAPGTAYECGDVRMAHGLPAHRTYNRGWAPALLYNSQHAHPRPIVYADVTVPATAAVPSSVQVVATVAGIATTVTYPGSEFTPGVARRVAVQVDGSGWATGVYPYVLQATSNYPSSSFSASFTGELPIVNRAGSPFGPGWWMAGLEQLICIGCATGGARMLWVGGDGSTKVYEPLSWWQTWVAQNPGGAPDTLTLVGYSYYVRKLPGGGRVELGGVGQHLRTVNRLGQATQFFTQNSGVPDSIHAPVPAGQGARSWVFTYGSGLTEVRARTPGAADRVVAFGHAHGDERITSITDPDSGVTAITYSTTAGATRMPVAVTDRRGTWHALAYDAAWKLASVRLYMDGA
ncbi:MAG TPA: hypothetical protein VEQ60_17995, partial [Longimicrobium sp.]|nr:hypothetical protein [Longimicrobium sp.]